MILSQGFQINDNNELLKPDQLSMDVDPKLIAQADQYQLNLRVDSDFVEDDGWHRAAQRFNHFIERYQQQKILWSWASATILPGSLNIHFGNGPITTPKRD